MTCSELIGTGAVMTCCARLCTTRMPTPPLVYISSVGCIYQLTRVAGKQEQDILMRISPCTLKDALVDLHALRQRSMLMKHSNGA